MQINFVIIKAPIGSGLIRKPNRIRTENNITYDGKSGYFKIYSNVVVESTDIIQTAGNFYSNKWFSNVVVFSEENDWYRKVLYIDILVYFMIFIKIFL